MGRKLNTPVQFLRAGRVDDGLSEVDVFEDFGDVVWASRADASDSERLSANEIAANITSRFTVPYTSFTSDLTPLDRLSVDGLEFDIIGIKEKLGGYGWLEITAGTRSDRRADVAG